jgi:hypothetical protein
MIAGVVPVERDVTVRHQLAHAASSKDLSAAQAMRGRGLSTWFGWLQVGCHRYSFTVDTGLHVAAGEVCAVDKPGYGPAVSPPLRGRHARETAWREVGSSSKRRTVVAEPHGLGSFHLTAPLQQASLRVRRGLHFLARWWARC